MNVIVFWGLLLALVVAAARFGGAPERWTAVMFLAAAVASHLSYSPTAQMFYRLEILVAIVDVALLIGLIAILLAADRFWPICMVAIHSITVFAHLSQATGGQLTRSAYQMMTVGPSYAALGLLSVAIWRHQARLHRTGADEPWRIFFNR